MTPPESTDPGPAAPPARRRRRWAVIVVLLVVGLIVAGAAGIGLWEASSSPMLCNSCHIMKPYVAAWKASPHNKVACVQCHYPPGLRDTIWVKYQAVTQVVKWATKTYSSKPFAEVENGSCLRSGCHDRGRLDGKVVSKRGIMFDHKPHLSPTRHGQELRCTSCHTQIVVSTHIQVNQASCFLCHFKGVKTAREIQPIAGCTGCHQPPKGDIAVGSIRFNHEDIVRRGVACQRCHLNVIEGDGQAPRERCFTCHNQPDKLERYSDTRFLHEAHVAGKNIECGRCHTEIKHRLPPPIGVPSAHGLGDGTRIAMEPR